MSEIVSIVTGGSRGIGKATALRLAKEGHNVVIFGRDKNALKKTTDEVKNFDVNSEYFAGDVGDEKFVFESVKKIENEFGKIDNLINNAGIGIMKRFIDSSLDEFKEQINVNLYGVYNFTKAVLKGMIERKSGSIINISSLSGKNPLANGSQYAATKHALMGLMRSLMLEVREYNIRVAIVCPGSVNTHFSGTSNRTNEDKILQPEDVAETIINILKLPIGALISEVDLRPTNPK